MSACVNCGATSGLEIDHIVPRARGGADTPDNLQTLCGPCNRYKSAWTHEELASGDFREWRMTRTEIVRRQIVTIEHGSPVEWPRGFDWEKEAWDDSAPVEWITGAMFTYPKRGPVNA